MLTSTFSNTLLKVVSMYLILCSQTNMNQQWTFVCLFIKISPQCHGEFYISYNQETCLAAKTKHILKHIHTCTRNHMLLQRSAMSEEIIFGHLWSAVIWGVSDGLFETQSSRQHSSTVGHLRQSWNITVNALSCYFSLLLLWDYFL